MAALIGACAGAWNGHSLASAITGSIIRTVTSTAATAAKFNPMTAGFLGPFAGPVAAIATALILRQVFKAQSESVVDYQFTADNPRLNLFPLDPIMPIIGFPKEPIGSFENGELHFDSRAIAKIIDEQFFLG